MSTLNESQFAHIAEQLQAQRHQVLEQIREQVHDTDQAERLDRYAQLKDPGDYSVADLLGDMRLEALDRETEHLRAVEDAEVRIQKGTFGECVDCGIDIKAERLLAQPTASRCVECQERFEREHASLHSGNI